MIIYLRSSDEEYGSWQADYSPTHSSGKIGMPGWQMPYKDPQWLTTTWLSCGGGNRARQKQDNFLLSLALLRPLLENFFFKLH